MIKRLWFSGAQLVLMLTLSVVIGCKSASVTEISAKTAFGPEFRNYGNNTHDIRWTAIHGFEFKLSNKWTVNASFQRRDVDEGSGDNENAILVEVGYPLWNAPKKAEKAAHEMQIEELEKELRELGSELVAAEGLSFKRTDEAIAESNGKNGLTFAKKGE